LFHNDKIRRRDDRPDASNNQAYIRNPDFLLRDRNRKFCRDPILTLVLLPIGFPGRNSDINSIFCAEFNETPKERHSVLRNVLLEYYNDRVFHDAPNAKVGMWSIMEE